MNVLYEYANLGGCGLSQCLSTARLRIDSLLITDLELQLASCCQAKLPKTHYHTIDT
jgi:hypothetical protein